MRNSILNSYWLDLEQQHRPAKKNWIKIDAELQILARKRIVIHFDGKTINSHIFISFQTHDEFIIFLLLDSHNSNIGNISLLEES